MLCFRYAYVKDIQIKFTYTPSFMNKKKQKKTKFDTLNCVVKPRSHEIKHKLV